MTSKLREDPIIQADSTIWGDLRIILLGSFIIIFITALLFPKNFISIIYIAVSFILTLLKIILSVLVVLASIFLQITNLISLGTLERLTNINIDNFRSNALQSIDQLITTLQSIFYGVIQDITQTPPPSGGGGGGDIIIGIE